jgi:hypothetical protein
MYWSTAGVRVDLDPTETRDNGDMILYTSLSDLNELTTLESVTTPYGTMSGSLVTYFGDWLEYIIEFCGDYLIDNQWEDYELFGIPGGKVARDFMTISFVCDLVNAKSPINIDRLNCNDFISNVVLTMFNEGDYDPCILFEGTLFEDEGDFCGYGIVPEVISYSYTYYEGASIDGKNMYLISDRTVE